MGIYKSIREREKKNTSCEDEGFKAQDYWISAMIEEKNG